MIPSKSDKDLAFSPASERNKAPILNILRQELPTRGRVLEIGAGTGQHAVHFAAALPQLHWQASDRDSDAYSWHSLKRRIAQAGLDNLPPPLALDVEYPGKLANVGFDAVYSANTAHIMHWDHVVAMFAVVTAVLEPYGCFLLYGPFNVGGAFTSDSNRNFDASLRLRDSGMGLRDLDDLDALSGRHAMHRIRCHDMPANNMLLVFARQTETD